MSTYVHISTRKQQLLRKAEARRRVIDLIVSDWIKGKITGDDEFVSTEIVLQRVKISFDSQPISREVIKEKEIREREIVFIRCRHCGNKVVESETRCPYCGAAL